MTRTVEDESALIAGLRNGDERAYAQLVDRYTPAMLRVARGYVRSHQIAEEVVQETYGWRARQRAARGDDEDSVLVAVVGWHRDGW